jgi:hypothetical protein
MKIGKLIHALQAEESILNIMGNGFGVGRTIGRDVSLGES